MLLKGVVHIFECHTHLKYTVCHFGNISEWSENNAVALDIFGLWWQIFEFVTLVNPMACGRTVPSTICSKQLRRVVVADFPGDTHPHTHTVVEEEETSFRGTQTEHKLSSKEAEQVGTTFERI